VPSREPYVLMSREAGCCPSSLLILCQENTRCASVGLGDGVGGGVCWAYIGAWPLAVVGSLPMGECGALHAINRPVLRLAATRLCLVCQGSHPAVCV
jgi:hypothetical protein